MHLVRGPQSTHAHEKLDRVSVTQSMFSDRDSQRKVAKQIELSHPPSLKKKKNIYIYIYIHVYIIIIIIIYIYTCIYNNNNKEMTEQRKRGRAENYY